MFRGFFVAPYKFALLYLVLLCITPFSAAAEKITIAAAADLKFVLEEIVASFRTAHPKAVIDIVSSSSGKIFSQIQAGAPFDLFFSADIKYPAELAKSGLAASPVIPYAIGRIVLWSVTRDARNLNLSNLTDPQITHIAIANPQHAPYGQRAAEALRASNIWEQVEPKLVYGENIAQTAQFVQSGSAEIGIIALSLALSSELTKQGGYWLIPETLHTPLVQGFIITKRAAENALAQQFANYMQEKSARTLMIKYGFTLPGE